MDEKYCHRCGAPVPEDAKFCTKCGAPVAGGDGDAPAPRNNHAEIRALLIAIGVLAALVAVIWVYGVYSEKRAARMEHDKFISDSMQAVERQRQDSIEWEQGRLDRIKTAYKKRLDYCLEEARRWERDYAEYNFSAIDGYYFLYDVTGDGIPELWVTSYYYDEGYCTDDYVLLHAYTYENEKLRRIYSGYDGFLSFHDCGNYLLGVWQLGDIAIPYQWFKFTYDGMNLTTKVIFSEYLNDPHTQEIIKRERTKPNEPEIKTYKVTDKSPIDRMTIKKT